jgi:hypothetical protein
MDILSRLNDFEQKLGLCMVLPDMINQRLFVVALHFAGYCWALVFAFLIFRLILVFHHSFIVLEFCFTDITLIGFTTMLDFIVISVISNFQLVYKILNSAKKTSQKFQ